MTLDACGGNEYPRRTKCHGSKLNYRRYNLFKIKKDHGFAYNARYAYFFGGSYETFIYDNDCLNCFKGGPSLKNCDLCGRAWQVAFIYDDGFETDVKSVSYFHYIIHENQPFYIKHGNDYHYLTKVIISGHGKHNKEAKMRNIKRFENVMFYIEGQQYTFRELLVLEAI